MPRFARLSVLHAAALLLFLLVCASASAAGVTATLQQALAELDVPILADRALPLAHLEELDGAAGGPAIDAGRFRVAVDELERASVPPLGWPTVAELRDQGRGGDLVPIALLDVAYARLRDDVLARGVLVADGTRLVPVPGATVDDLTVPARAFAAAALVERTYHGARVAFVVPRDLVLTAGGAAPVSLTVDADDGNGFRAVTPGTVFTASYVSTGRHILVVRSAGMDGVVREARASFTVEALVTPPPSETWPLTATTSYAGAVATGEAYVYLADGHATVTNPIVVVEGFDIDNSLNWDGLYALLNQENLLEDLRSEGYDGVVLNFTDSTDYIQRNAYLLQTLLAQVSAMLPAGQTYPLAGASMGGLVSRYALASLEAGGSPDPVSTFISLDGAQNGADVPLGIQYWLDFFQDESSDAAYLLSRLDTPAARQMLVYHHTSPPGATGESDPLRGVLQGELASLGEYPTAPRLVAVANGSGSMQDQGFAPGAQIIAWNYSSLLVDITGNVWAVPDGSSTQILDGVINLIWPLPDSSLQVTVSGTLPWDGAPGGWRDSMAQMDAVSAPYGDIVALHANHCFIPVRSSLDLDVTDPFYDVAGDPDILAHTPFDAVYFPVANQEHVLITAQNKIWILDEVQSPSTAAPEGAAVAARPALLGNYPNPFNPRTTIAFSLPAAGHARLAVYDVRGALVTVLADDDLAAGRHAVAWQGCDAAGHAVAAGTYVYRLEAAGAVASGRLALVK